MPQYGIGPIASITGGPNAFSGRNAASPSASEPQCAENAGEFRIRSIRRGLKSRDQHRLVRLAPRKFAEEPQDVERARQRMRDDAAGDHRTDRMQWYSSERQSRSCRRRRGSPRTDRDARRRWRARRAIGEDEIGRAQVVEREAVLRHQPADAAAERQSSDAGAADDAAGRGEAMQLRLAIQFLPQDAALGANRARRQST